VNPRWYHDYFPLVADVAADRGRLDRVRAAAETFRAVEVDPSEEAKKLGVLNPLARAEIDAALATAGDERADHLSRARAAVTRGQEILKAFPPPTEGSVQMETHRTHLAFTCAELSRAVGSDPVRWHEAFDRADYCYFRLYAQFRLAEALLVSGDEREGTAELRAAFAIASDVGATRIQAQLERAADAAGVSVRGDAESVPS
jgi:hypothetical protein